MQITFIKKNNSLNDAKANNSKASKATKISLKIHLISKELLKKKLSILNIKDLRSDLGATMRRLKPISLTKPESWLNKRERSSQSTGSELSSPKSS